MTASIYFGLKSPAKNSSFRKRTIMIAYFFQIFSCPAVFSSTFLEFNGISLEQLLPSFVERGSGLHCRLSLKRLHPVV